jgi:hypothetical protein
VSDKTDKAPVEKRGGDTPLNFTTGDDVRRPAKFGFPRREDDGNAAYDAQRRNNADPADPEFLGLLELVDGRCPLDGLPEGNCAHFPGPQLVLGPDGRQYDSRDTAWDERGNQVVREGALRDREGTRPDGSRSVSPIGNPDKDDQETSAEQATRKGEGSGTPGKH